MTSWGGPPIVDHRLVNQYDGLTGERSCPQHPDTCLPLYTKSLLLQIPRIALETQAELISEAPDYCTLLSCFFVIFAAQNPWLCGTFLKKCDEICGIFMRWNCGNLQKLRERAKKCGNKFNFITFPWQQGEMAALVWSKRNILIYVTFLQQKCRDYEIMQAPRILRGNLQFMLWKCGIFEKYAAPSYSWEFGWLDKNSICKQFVAANYRRRKHFGSFA